MKTKNLYESVSPGRKVKRDKGVLKPLCLALALSLVILIPAGLAMRLMYRYRCQVDELTDSFVQAEKAGRLTADWGEKSYPVPRERATRVYTMVVEAGIGRIRREIPAEGDRLRLDFGDGTELLLVRVHFSEGERLAAAGVLLCYTNPEGERFIHDTDSFSLTDVLRALGLPLE